MINRSLIVAFAGMAIAGCHPTHSSSPPMFGVPPSCRQVVLVKVVVPPSHAQVMAFARDGDAWRTAITPMPATVGKNGIAKISEKHEGDGCTPSGVFPIESAFGYAPTINTQLDYRMPTSDDFWIDDPNSPNYNQWVTSATPPPVSHEVLRRADDFYSQGAVIGYNRDPVVPGRGSAIFLHIWEKLDNPTTGCLALASPDVAKLLGWLDKKKHPVVAILPPGDSSDSVRSHELKK